jgi:hypothetical protein
MFRSIAQKSAVWKRFFRRRQPAEVKLKAALKPPRRRLQAANEKGCGPVPQFCRTI